MDYYSFFEKLQKADSRVRFSEGINNKKCNNLEIPEFYRVVNPINVEFEFNDGVVKLASFEELSALNKEYQYIRDGCVFATCNGDPIYIRAGEIFTSVHGTRHTVEEKIATSLEKLFEQAAKML